MEREGTAERNDSEDFIQDPGCAHAVPCSKAQRRGGPS